MIFQNQIQPRQHPAEDPSGNPNQAQDKIYIVLKNLLRYNSGFPSGSAVKKPAATQELKEIQVRSLGQKIPWRRAWQPTPVFLPGEFHGQRSLAGRLQSMGSWRVRHDLAHTYARYNWDTTKSIQSIQFNVWQNPLKCCEVISLQLIKINEKKKYTIPWFHYIYRVLNIHNNLIFITPKRNCEPMSSLSSCPLPQSLAMANLLSVSVDLPVLDILNMCAFIWLLPLSMCQSFPPCGMYQYFTPLYG